ncbi:EpsG family protein [Legionella hackeliae]|uniref:Transmembrane protein n=1 Tax=Legionella hackeliae TaxID=449 RepID=A0A0A8UND0_LEGHA|nr:EpsG family protein [Legionella hackeliae]KTD08820.1 hypothetical protein Lhac_3043 [Legionella hackeliae]CEK10248.1 membrane protein of unknown function [Legionella hackeliae]STX46977.1 Uncharacterised protein [Legionella hackeliae]
MRIKYSNLQIALYIWPVLILLALAIGFRPMNVGSDTQSYSLYYENLRWGMVHHFYEYLFFILAKIFSLSYIPIGYFFSFIALTGFILINLSARKITEYLEVSYDSNLVFLLLIICFSLSVFFYAIEINVIRHGIAILALFLFYFLLINRAHILLLMLSALFAVGFHQTSVVYLLVSFLIFFSYRFVFSLVLVLAFLYVTGLIKKSIFIFSQMTSINIYEKIASYGLNSGYASGNRLDFTLFTLFCGLLFFIIGKYLLNANNRRKYNQLLKIYWILTIPFFFLGFAGYADRYLLPAWVYLSILSAVFLQFEVSKSSLAIKITYLVFLASAIVIYMVAQGILRLG